MLKGFIFLLKYTWKFNKMYVFYIFTLQIFTSIMPLLAVILPKYIIDELMGQKRIDVLALLIGILIGYNLIGGMIITSLRGRSFTSKGIVFNKFQTFIAEKLALCDYEQIENPEFLDIKEKAGKFLYANGQGFGVVLDSAINILGKVFIFAGLIAVLSTLNIIIVLLFIGLVLLNSFIDAKVRKNYVKWDMENCLICSGFTEKLSKLDKGIHTNIYKNFEPDGFEPSGGEGQKIALARALYKNAPIVILDEPTAALDPRAEYEIYQHFNELVEGKTAIYISHRLSSTRFCDNIAVFRSGEIIEYGSHNELIQQKSMYSELFNMQAQFYV